MGVLQAKRIQVLLYDFIVRACEFFGNITKNFFLIIFNMMKNMMYFCLFGMTTIKVCVQLWE